MVGTTGTTRSAGGAGPVAALLRWGAALVGAGAGVVAAGAAAQRVIDLRVGRLPAPGDHVEVDGRAVHVATFGPAPPDPAQPDPAPPDAPVVVAETGVGGTSADWERVADHLGGRIRFLAVDRPGLGRSELGPPPDLAAATRRLEEVMAADGATGPVVLAGWSFGGLLDLGIALTRPDLVAGLVLVDPSHPDEARRFHDPALHPVGRLAWRGVGLGSRLGGAAVAGIPARLAYLRVATLDGREPLWQVPTYATASAGRALAEEMLAFPRVCDEVGALRRLVGTVPPVPSVLLSATRRRDRREAAIWEELHRDLTTWVPGMDLVEVEGSGHDMPADRPAAVAEAVERVVAAAAVLSTP